MRIVEQFNEAIDRELSRLTQEQIASLEDAVSQFDTLVKLGLVQPERYRLEPIGTISFNPRPHSS